MSVRHRFPWWHFGGTLSTKRVNGYLHVVWYSVLSIDPTHHKCLWFCPWSVFRSENISHVPTQGGIYLEHINMQILSPCSVVYGSVLDPTYLDYFWLRVGFALGQFSAVRTSPMCQPKEEFILNISLCKYCQGGSYLEHIIMQILSPCSGVFGSLLDHTYLVGFALGQFSAVRTFPMYQPKERFIYYI